MGARRHVRRVVGILGVGLEIALILGATGLLLLWCSVPNTGALVEENPRSTAFIELRQSEAAEAQERLEAAAKREAAKAHEGVTFDAAKPMVDVSQ